MKRKIPLILTSAALVLLALVADSRYHLSVTRYDLFFSSLPPEAEELRIVLLSDLHGMRFGEENSRLAEKVRELSPDVIALTGDFVSFPNDDLESAAAAEELITALEGVAPMYWVNGNHEWARINPHKNIEKMLTGHGVHCLDNAFEPLSPGSSVILAGLDDKKSWYGAKDPAEFAAAVREEYPGSFVILLKHRNDSITETPSLPVDLILSGHAHGGIVRLPFFGGILNHDGTVGSKYDAGVYQGRGYQLAVSRGLGNSIVVPRFLNRPEIVLLRLFSSERH